MFTHLSSHKQKIIRRNETSINNYCHRQTTQKVCYFNNATEEKWFKDGKHHRIDAPAAVSYYKTGQLQYEGWYKYGKLHRPNGAPAVITYFENGQIDTEEWYKNGEIHRIDAPAVILYFENGQIEDVKWYEDGNEIFYRRYIKYFADIVTYICHGKK